MRHLLLSSQMQASAKIPFDAPRPYLVDIFIAHLMKHSFFVFINLNSRRFLKVLQVPRQISEMTCNKNNWIGVRNCDIGL